MTVAARMIRRRVNLVRQGSNRQKYPTLQTLLEDFKDSQCFDARDEIFGLLSIAGERKSSLPQADSKAAVHINERFAGRFRRALSMPDDADPDGVEARLRDGVLHITVRRKASAQPRRITVQ